jgi:4-hydroxy-tetrahydrodipicolinate reductase
MGSMKIVVVGSGKLANAIVTSDLCRNLGELVTWEQLDQTLIEKVIVVHAGSGRQLKECFAYCSATKSIFLELSTGLETEKMNPDFPLIICPNTSLLVLKTLNLLKRNGRYFENYKISITESHQSTKVTEPGTAFAFADALKVPTNQIASIRDPEVQRNFIGIPNEYISKHAYHKIVIQDGSDEVTLETKVLGHDSYAKGVGAIIEAMIKHPLENKKFTVLDLIDQNLL